AYGLAMLASDAAIPIAPIFDGRPQRVSRFIVSSRAHCIVHSPGTAPAVAGIARGGGTLSVDGDQADAPAMVTERLLVCGGWQPDLTLWHIAGGASQWHHGHDRLEAVGTLDAIALAGRAAGYL